MQALDAACNILYLSISTLPDGEAVIAEIYKDSPSGYRSVYKQTTAEQVMSWLNGFGEKLLAEGNYKVYEIADMLGFESAFYFSKVFKKIEGISPTEYQNAQYV